MSQSLCKIHLHMVFSTKNRRPLLTPDARHMLFPYMAHRLASMGCPAVEIGGVQDLVHILATMAKSLSVEDLMKDLKATSSQWMKKQDIQYHDFYWQSGYGVFAISPSHVARVREYIIDQEKHHAKESFQEEFLKILNRYQIQYDERYLWD